MAKQIVIIIERQAPRDSEVHSATEINATVLQGLAANYPRNVIVTDAIMPAHKEADLEERVARLMHLATEQVARHKLLMCAYVGAYPIFLTEGVVREAVVVVVGGPTGPLHLDAVFESRRENNLDPLHEAAVGGMRDRLITEADPTAREEAQRLAGAVLSVFKKALRKNSSKT